MRMGGCLEWGDCYRTMWAPYWLAQIFGGMWLTVCTCQITKQKNIFVLLLFNILSIIVRFMLLLLSWKHWHPIPAVPCVSVECFYCFFLAESIKEYPVLPFLVPVLLHTINLNICLPRGLQFSQDHLWLLSPWEQVGPCTNWANWRRLILIFLEAVVCAVL